MFTKPAITQVEEVVGLMHLEVLQKGGAGARPAPRFKKPDLRHLRPYHFKPQID
jgi:hypothetical protein